MLSVPPGSFITDRPTCKRYPLNTTPEARASLTAKSSFSTPRSVIVLSIAASIVTMLLKFGAYFLTGSVSLLWDAAESSVNLIAALVAFGALTVVGRPPIGRTTTATTRPSISPAVWRAR